MGSTRDKQRWRQVLAFYEDELVTLRKMSDADVILMIAEGIGEVLSQLAKGGNSRLEIHDLREQGRRLHQYRLELSLSREEIATRMEIHFEFIVAMEHGMIPTERVRILHKCVKVILDNEKRNFEHGQLQCPDQYSIEPEPPQKKHIDQMMPSRVASKLKKQITKRGIQSVKFNETKKGQSYLMPPKN